MCGCIANTEGMGMMFFRKEVVFFVDNKNYIDISLKNTMRDLAVCHQ